MSEKYYWTDLESGVTSECSKEFKEKMDGIWESTKPKLINDEGGQVLIFGTGGAIEGNSFKDLFYGRE